MSHSPNACWSLTLAGVLIALVAAMSIVALATDDPSTGGPASAGAPTSPAPIASPPPAPTGTATASALPRPITFPVRGSGRFTVVSGRSAVIGRGGNLLTFRVAVENGIANVDLVELAAFVERTYADPGGWTANGRLRIQRVGPDERSDFTVYLATPATRDVLCDMGYDRYTSCRNGDRVVINIDRWVNAVPGYGAPLETYRQYVLNHETGHRLGYGHERCPGRGRPAPVMQQQTLGLYGCLANRGRTSTASPTTGRRVRTPDRRVSARVCAAARARRRSPCRSWR